MTKRLNLYEITAAVLPKSKPYETKTSLWATSANDARRQFLSVKDETFRWEVKDVHHCKDVQEAYEEKHGIAYDEGQE